MFQDMLVEASISQQTMARLPRPFQTDCEAYEKGSFRKEWGGYQTHAGCIQECQMRIEQEVCNCTLAYHEYSALFAGRLCAYQVQKMCTDALNKNGMITKCEDCHLGCEQSTYNVRLAGISGYKQTNPKM
ncbi:hypothetical protein BIW11_03806 [Tropilaelaps mercedesae]|uniref:Uncharacterized protein n=1 Tax=Tropilaelaps mercedesae TaxID=418985 RepID=A0A1V9XFQ7_9ACAR|nr:hypothetical protein BIW11_03806 [Tropilaelaps mercedesae]